MARYIICIYVRNSPHLPIVNQAVPEKTHNQLFDKRAWIWPKLGMESRRGLAEIYFILYELYAAPVIREFQPTLIPQ